MTAMNDNGKLKLPTSNEIISQLKESNSQAHKIIST